MEKPASPGSNETMAIKLACVCMRVVTMILLMYIDTLLRNAAEFVDKLMEIDEELCTQWSCPELVLAIMEAVKQIGYSAALFTNNCLVINSNNIVK